MRGRAALTAGLGALAGCTLLVDTSGLTGGSSDAPDASTSSDATADAVDEGDGPRDAPLEEADAATDAPPASDAHAPLGEAGCTGTVHDFCDDFDHGALGAAWTRTFQIGGAFTLDPLAVSPPSSLLATAADGGSENLILVKNFAGATKGIRCQVALRVDAYDNYTDVLHVDFTVAGEAYFVRVGLGGGGTLNEYGQLPDGGERVRNNWPFQQPPAGQWVDVVLDIDGDPNAGAATLAVDGAQVLSVALSPPTDATGINVELGAINTFPLAWRAHYDNVACDLRK
jgi:hypothetical protein